MPVAAYKPNRRFEDYEAWERPLRADETRGPLHPNVSPPTAYAPPIDPERPPTQRDYPPSNPNFTGANISPYQPPPSSPPKPFNTPPTTLHRDSARFSNPNPTSSIPHHNRYQSGSYNPNGFYSPNLGGFHPNVDSGRYPTVSGFVGDGGSSDLFYPSAVADFGPGNVGGFRPDLNMGGLPPPEYSPSAQQSENIQTRRRRASSTDDRMKMDLSGVGGLGPIGSGTGHYDENPSTPGVGVGPQLGDKAGKSAKSSWGRRLLGKTGRAVGQLTGTKDGGRTNRGSPRP